MPFVMIVIIHGSIIIFTIIYHKLAILKEDGICIMYLSKILIKFVILYLAVSCYYYRLLRHTGSTQQQLYTLCLRKNDTRKKRH